MDTKGSLELTGLNLTHPPCGSHETFYLLAYPPRSVLAPGHFGSYLFRENTSSFGSLVTLLNALAQLLLSCPREENEQNRQRSMGEAWLQVPSMGLLQRGYLAEIGGLTGVRFWFR